MRFCSPNSSHARFCCPHSSHAWTPTAGGSLRAGGARRRREWRRGRGQRETGEERKRREKRGEEKREEGGREGERREKKACSIVTLSRGSALHSSTHCACVHVCAYLLFHSIVYSCKHLFFCICMLFFAFSFSSNSCFHLLA